MRALVGAWAWAVGALVCRGGDVAVSVRPGFEGLFRPGAPVWLRATVANGGAAFDGALELTVEGVTYRQAARVGAQATGLADAFVAARAEGARARVVVRSAGGRVLHESDVALGLRRGAEGRPLVVAVAAPRAVAEELFGSCAAAAAADELPPLAAGYAALDGLAFAGDGGEVPAAGRPAIADWVRGGGVAGFALEEKAPVRSDSLLAELGGCAGRASAEEWLAAPARRTTRELGGGRMWRVGLGTVCAGVRPKLAAKAFAGLLRADVASRDEWTDAGLYAAFRGARWDAAVRWRLVGGGVALLVAGALVARLAWRGRGRAAKAALAAGTSVALAAVAWAVMLPEGRGCVEAACVFERAKGQTGERRTEVVCVEAVGRARVRLDFGAAEAVVPFYRSGEDAGGGEAVIERDAAGRWTAECALTQRTRRCFAAWWPWREGAPPEALGARFGDLALRRGRVAEVRADSLDGGPWFALEEFTAWGDAHRSLALWQRRRAARASYHFIRCEEPWRSAITAKGVLEERRLAAQVWTLGED